MSILRQRSTARLRNVNLRRRTLNYPRLMFADSFTGSAGALTSHTPNTGSSWSAQSAAVYSLTGSGAVQCSDAGSSSIGVVLALAPALYPQNVTITCDVVNLASGQSGIAFNYTDATTYWFLDASGGGIYQVAASTPTQRIAGSGDSSGTSRIVLTPTSVTWYLNGTLKGTYTRSQPTNTKIGTFCDGAEAGSGGTWDNLRITTP